jgi:hypothetical protein
MYRGFNLKYSSNQNEIDYYYSIGNKIFTQNKIEAKKNLSSFIFSDNSLDGSSIQDTWFPKISADIFISHSHNDEKTAITLAGWLWDNFKLKSFIDSCIWGHSNELLKSIDDKYCYQSNGTYNYQLRNFSTSHVHSMLSTAIFTMIDKSEVLFFLNTPSSIKSWKGKPNTESPWLYTEIHASRLIQKNVPERYMNELNEGLSGIGDPLEKARNFSVNYNVELNHLNEIDVNCLNKWSNHFRNPNAISNHALDSLYELFPFKNKL